MLYMPGLGCIGTTRTNKQCFSSTSPIPPESGGGQFSLHSAGSSELPDSFIVPKCSKISGEHDSIWFFHDVMDFPTGY